MDTPLEEVTHTDNIKLSDDGRSVVIIDQTLLPNRLEYIALTTREEMFEAIAMLRVRGAPAIGICAGYCAYCLALQAPHDSFDDFYDHWVEDCRYLNGSRPTAVNLSWALNRMLDTALGIVVALVVNLAMPGPKKPAPVSALEDMDGPGPVEPAPKA